ncbi:MAG: M16 family metallopeptidase, partial [Terriglobia bacterium]
AMLRKFYNTWYAPNNAILVIVGDVDPAKALARAQRLFGPIAAKKLPARPEMRFAPVPSATLNLKTDRPYGLAVLSFRMPGMDSPDYAAAQVLSDVLSSQRGTLYGLVPAGKALFAGFSLSGLPGASLSYAVAGFPQGSDGHELLDEVRKILADDVQNGVPADLVAASKRHTAADAEFQKNSVSGLAMAWSQALAVEGRRSPDDDVRAIERVTVQDVDRVAKRYLTLNGAISAVLSPQASGKPVSSKSFGGKESFASKHVKPVPLPAWAQQALERLDIPQLTTHPIVSTLPNGIRLIVQPETISDTVSVYGHIRNTPELETPKGHEGVDGVLDDLFSYGSTTLGRIAFQKALDDIGADESAGTDFSVQVLAGHFDRAVALLADNELRPALPAQAFAIIRSQTARAVAGRLESPDYLTSRALRIALFPRSDPTLRQSTPATISALRLEDVKSYYQRAFRPDLTTIVVIGHVDPARAKAVVEKHFNAWHSAGPKPPTTLPAVPPNGRSATIVPDSSRVQVRVLLAENLGLNRFNPAYYALNLGNHVLGGGFYASRLYQDLRENAGLVYYVSSSLDSGRTRTVYRLSYGCDPPNVSKARSIIVRDLKAMQAAAVTPRELRQAKALLLREIPLSESSVDGIADGWISRSDIGLPLDEPVRAARRYVDLTGADVRAALVKWLRPNDLVQVTEGPAPK